MSLSNLIKVANYYNTKYDFEESESLIKEATGKYDHIDFKPPESAAKAAARGLELRKKNKGKGGLSVQQAHKQGIGSGVARAVSLKNRQTLSPATVRRMKAFFDRHEKNKSASGGKPLTEDKGYIAWLIWGGDPGRSWANKIVNQMNAADKKTSRAAGVNSLRKRSASIHSHFIGNRDNFGPILLENIRNVARNIELTRGDLSAPSDSVDSLIQFIEDKQNLLGRAQRAQMNEFDDEKNRAYNNVIRTIQVSIADAKKNLRDLFGMDW